VFTDRNFNRCPHCLVHGAPALLHRLREGLPMISRSDGETFHLVLADRPLPYPIERSAGPTRRISVCLCYCHIGRSTETYCSIVILRASQTNRPSIFRMIVAGWTIFTSSFPALATRPRSSRLRISRSHFFAPRKCWLTMLGVSTTRFSSAHTAKRRNCAMLHASGVALPVPAPNTKWEAVGSA
jgi:hypothetical protein